MASVKRDKTFLVATWMTPWGINCARHGDLKAGIRSRVLVVWGGRGRDGVEGGETRLQEVDG